MLHRVLLEAVTGLPLTRTLWSLPARVLATRGCVFWHTVWCHLLPGATQTCQHLQSTAVLRANSFLNGCNLLGCVFVNTRCLCAACLAQLSHREGTSAGKHLAASLSQVGQPWEEPGARKPHGAASSRTAKQHTAPGVEQPFSEGQRAPALQPCAQSQPHLGVPASCGCPWGSGVTVEQPPLRDSRGMMAPCWLCGMLGLPVPTG